MLLIVGAEVSADFTEIRRGARCTEVHSIGCPSEVTGLYAEDYKSQRQTQPDKNKNNCEEKK